MDIRKLLKSFVFEDPSKDFSIVGREVISTSVKKGLVAIGRPVIYGLALGGRVGVRQVFEHLNDELKTVMQLSGTQTIEDVKRFKLRHNPYDPSFTADSHDLKLY